MDPAKTRNPASTTFETTLIFFICVFVESLAALCKMSENLDQRAVTIMLQNPQFFVGWGTLSLINAGLAQAKNRSGLLWWVASVFFGPLATLLIVVMPKHKESL